MVAVQADAKGGIISGEYGVTMEVFFFPTLVKVQTAVLLGGQARLLFLLNLMPATVQTGVILR